ncbi:uncharacterized protein LOC144860823 isoform X2 [Branchiostoma floridae x Branchiostoma japonicum]
MAHQLSALTLLYRKISDHLSGADVRDLRALLVPDHFGLARVENKTPHEMFNMLQADNKIGEGNLRLLVQILKTLGKGRLAEEAEQLELEQGTEAVPQKAPVMSEAHRTLLLRNYPTLYQELDATTVLGYLHQQEVLTDEMRQKILAIPEDQRHHRAGTLLHMILQMGDNAFAIFCTALGHAGYKHLMDLLTVQQQQQQVMPPMPMALAAYPCIQGKEGFVMPIEDQPELPIQNQQFLSVYQKEQIRLLKMKMRLKALEMYQGIKVKSLERAKESNLMTQGSIEREYQKIQNKMKEKHEAIIVSINEGCVILFLTFESEPKFEHLWGSYTSGDLSNTLTELLITEEMRSLEGGDQLVMKTLVLEQDYIAWRDFFKKGDPQGELVTSLGTSRLKWAGSIQSIASEQSVASTVSSGSGLSSDSGNASAGIQMTLSEGKEIASKYKAEAEAAISKITEGMGNIDKEITATKESCQEVEREIQQHYKILRSQQKLEEQEMIKKVQEVNRDRKGELTQEKKKLQTELGKTKERVAFYQKILDCKDDKEFPVLKQQMEERLQKPHETGDKSFVGHTRVTFQACSLSQASGGSLSVFTLQVEEPAVESLPCSVTVTTDIYSTADLTGGDITVTPQIEVTSPQGKTTLIQTTAHSSPPLTAEKGQTSRVRRVWGGEWRPQESRKHTLGVCMKGIKDLGSLTVDVGSNNPVLRFGQKGSQQGQFDSPIDVAVRGDRLYVADTGNNRVQVFDLSGKFCSSFSTTIDPVGIAVQTDGTIVVTSGLKVENFFPTGQLLNKFRLVEYCTHPWGLAVQRDGRVVVADPDKHSIFQFEADGTLVKQVGGWGQGEGQFDMPLFVCVDEEDNIIVEDKLNNRVQVFDMNLNFQHKFGQDGSQSQDMFGPTGVSADSSGNIVLANHRGKIDGVEHSGKLQVFQLDGMWVSTISSDGDKLKRPHGVAVTEDGHVFVADFEDHCIRKYRYM